MHIIEKGINKSGIRKSYKIVDHIWAAEVHSASERHLIHISELVIGDFTQIEVNGYQFFQSLAKHYIIWF